MQHILDTIIAHKKKQIEEQKKVQSIDDFFSTKNFQRPVLSLKKNILDITKTGIIAEFKRQSPSKGIINNKATISEVIKGYEQYGASGVSILTDEHFFGGSKFDIFAARDIRIPILRKDFIVDEFQIYEAKAIGADCILLIASCLTKTEIAHFADIAKQLGLEVLLELHTEKEIDSINDNVDMVGINNRNLQTFEVDLAHSFSLLKQIPRQFVSVAESGIQSKEDLNALKKEGFQGFLIGEQFMKHEKPAEAFATFLQG